MIDKKCVNKNLPYLFVLVIMGIPLVIGTTYQYTIIFVIMALIIFTNFTFHIRTTSTIDKIPFAILLVWLFGVCIGIVRGNNLSEVFQNYAGMVVYLFGIVLLNTKQIKLESLYKALYLASILVSVEVLMVFAFHSIGRTPPWPLSNIRYNTWTSSIYSGFSAIIFVLEAISLWSIFQSQQFKQTIIHTGLFALSASAIFLTMDSSGYILGYITVLGIILFLMLKKKKMTRQYWVLSAVFFLAIIIIAILYQRRSGALGDIFSINSSGNGKRYYQFVLVYDRFKLLGNGLGSHLVYSYGIRIFDSYGLEVSYLNIVDKFGIVGFVLIGIYIYTFVMPIIMLKKSQGVSSYSVISIGLQGYLFVAIGNPVIYAPYNVILHIFAILFISYNGRSQNIGETL